MFAVIETGGKQIKAAPGSYIDIEKIPQTKGEKVSLSNILMLVNGKESKVGNPFIKGAKVNGKVIEEGKDDKVIVYKMRPKKGTRKKTGHRQYYSRVFIETIELDGSVISKAEPKVKKEKVKKEEPVLETNIEDTESKKQKKKLTKKKEK